MNHFNVLYMLIVLIYLDISISQEISTDTTVLPDTTLTDTTLPDETTTVITTAAATTTTVTTTITTTIPPITTPTPENVHLDSQSSSFTWSSDEPYHSSSSIIVQADEGYAISATISEIDIDGENGDYLLLKSGTTYGGAGDGRIFTYSVASKLKYYYNSNTVFGYFLMNGDNPKYKNGYSIVFERTGNPTTSTTLNPTTDNNWPTPGPNDASEITVNLTASTSNIDYLRNEFLNIFKNSVADMAIEYCDFENVYLAENITQQNVLVSKFVHCPYVWINSENCVQITFSLPVFLNESAPSKWMGYQLNAEHLNIMWERLTSKYLPESVIIYDTPDVDDIIKWWAIAIAVVTAIFIILLCLFRVFSSKFSSISWKRRMSDTLSFVSSRKDSHNSLAPHYLQEIPKLFENEYSTYTP